MAPKVKYTREQIIDVAVEMTRENGIESVTARNLAARLGTSSRPIFTAFENMEELHAEIKRRVREIYRDYQKDFKDYKPAFKRHGMQTILFAQTEPQFFRILFMQKNEDKTLRESMEEDIANVDEIIEVIQRDYGLDEEHAMHLLEHMWIHTYGISVLCAQGVCVFEEVEISRRLSESFIGMLTVLKSNQLQNYANDTSVEKIGPAES